MKLLKILLSVALFLSIINTVAIVNISKNHVKKSFVDLDKIWAETRPNS